MATMSNLIDFGSKIIVRAPGRKNFQFDLDLKLNLIYDLIFFGK